MKLTHIIAIIVIAIAIGVVISTTGDASTYVTFSEAKKMESEGEGDKVHIVGMLKKSPSGELLEVNYQPEKDPNFFEFTLVDDNKEEHSVVYFNPKPQDFERSEKIVVIGQMKGEHFVADKIVMKCPSKYQETEFKEGNTQSSAR